VNGSLDFWTGTRKRHHIIATAIAAAFTCGAIDNSFSQTPYKLLWSDSGSLICSRSISVSNDGTMVVASLLRPNSAGVSIEIFDSETGKVVRNIKAPAGRLRDSVVISADGNIVASIYTEKGRGGVEIIERASGRARSIVSPAVRRDNFPKDISTDRTGERMLLSYSSYASAELWDTKASKVVKSFNHRVATSISTIEVETSKLSHDGTRALTSSSFSGGEDTIRVWDVASGKLLGETEFPSASVMQPYFSRDNKRILTTDFQGRVWLFDEFLKADARVIASHSPGEEKMSLADAVITHDGQRVVSISRGAVKITDFTGKELQSFQAYSPKGPNLHNRVNVLPDDRIVTMGADGVGKCGVKMWGNR